MLRSVKELQEFTINATDGQIGHVKDTYFDDQNWVVRYLLVNSGFWMLGRMVLISPVSLRKPDWENKSLPALISKEQIRSSPDINTDKPISRQQEKQYLDYFGYPFYWDGVSSWGNALFPYEQGSSYTSYEDESAGRARQIETFSHIQQTDDHHNDQHLRSCKTVDGYRVRTSDGQIGHIDDILIDEQTWAIRYLVVETSQWWLGHKVLIAPEWITGVHWPDKTLSVELSLESVQKSPHYDPKQVWNRELDIRLYLHYDRHGYWDELAV